MNFNKYIDRRQYSIMKWNPVFLTEYFGNQAALLISVADMDIKSPPMVIEQLQK